MNVASIIKMLAAVAWIAFFGLIFIVVLRASRNKNLKGAITILVVALCAAIVLSIVSAGLVFIKPEQRGVVISALQPGGIRPEPLQPGLRWIIPFFESVVTYPIRRQTYTMSIAPNEGELQGDDFDHCPYLRWAGDLRGCLCNLCPRPQQSGTGAYRLAGPLC